MPARPLTEKETARLTALNIAIDGFNSEHPPWHAGKF
jgi:hypothetical protein